MALHKKYGYASLFIILLLLFAACTHTVENDTGSHESAKDSLTLVADFSREDGIARGGNVVRLSFDGNRTDYPLDRGGKIQMTGLPRNGDLLLTVFDPQGQSVGSMTLSLSEGAVIDASTSEDGIGYITLRKDTDVVALSFSLLGDGSLQCGLWLTQSDEYRSLS